MSAGCALPAGPGAPHAVESTRDSARLLSGELPPLPGGWREAEQVLVLWDGDCGFCGRCVLFAKRRDARSRLLFVPYQRVPDPPLGATLRADCARAMQAIRTDGSLLRGGRGAVYCLEQVGWWWARPMRFAPLAWLTELGYWLVARNRRLFSRQSRHEQQAQQSRDPSHAPCGRKRLPLPVDVRGRCHHAPRQRTCPPRLLQRTCVLFLHRTDSWRGGAGLMPWTQEGTLKQRSRESD